ncbi:1927_t:CDS:2 [Acaulospora morrowiae]|uniref:1927_t:CDS:1 n=1 Tax=Acaulospora morrowiae TaxID=94023 RepID=A0A9N9B5G2_9GLOM|nr:1927_t:CDS:2 [Acaulospora morrowiae]
MAELNFYILFCSFAAVLGSFQYGYHIGELNIPQDVISCKKIPKDTVLSEYSLSPCIKMNDAEVGLVTAIFTLGGLLGSLLASRVADSKGRRQTLLLNNFFLGIAPIIMGFANSVSTLVFGRVLVGIGCGVVTVVVPMYLAEISPVEYRGTFGVMNQLGIVTGILFSQLVGLYLSYVPGWRLILLGGAVISIIQIIVLGFSVESPRFLASRPGGFHSAKRALQKLRGNADIENELGGWQQVASEEVIADDDNVPLSLGSEDGDAITADPADPPPVVFRAHTRSDGFDVWKFLTSPHYRPALKVILLAHSTQQLSGINAVLYYSTNILSKILPDSSDLITVYISVVNTLMTLVSAYLMDRSGRRTLLLYSIGSMSAASALLGFGIIHDYGFLSALSIILFVATFSFGLGPIPFLITPEIVDTHAAATASSLGMGLNWVSNFIIGFVFLSVSKMIGGYVFYIFAIYLAGSFILARRLVPETKAKTVEEVWRGWTGK